MTISQLLETGLQINKDARSLFDDKTTLTYGELRAKMDRIAAHIQQQGVRVGDMVALVMPRSMEYVIAEAACLLYGFGVVLLDSGYPKDRVRFCVEDSGAKLVINNTFYARSMDFTGLPQKETVKEDTPALAVYTSGSTGRPKGVLHDQSSIGNYIDRMFALTNPAPSDVVGSVSPFTFAASFMETIKALCSGASLTVIPRDLLMNPIELAEYIDKNQITHVYMPPKVLKIFKKKGNSLKQIFTASEPVRYVAPDGYQIFNLYGMSEMNVVTAFEIDKSYDNTPIGTALKGVKAYLLNDKNEICDEGELCIAGHFMTGYIGLPEKTKETIVNNPFFAQDGHEFMIRTGDLARRLPDGNLLFVNRKDWMIKINGQRVEPGEVEYAMRQIPGVRDAAVKAFEEGERTYICGFYAAQEDVSDELILTELSKHLPGYMIPERLVKMDALPLNVNGKLDRMSLKPPAVQTQCVQPQTKEEEIALALAKEIITDVDFGVTDDLDVLGLDSIHAMEFSVRLKEAGLDVSTSTVMKCRNIRDMLSKGNSMVWFVEEYDEEKPTLVITSGIVVLRPVLPFYKKLAKRYNVLLIEPVQDHYESTLKGLKYDELIVYYMERIVEQTPDPSRIIGFMGFSFGGELSASLAHRYEDLYGRKTFAIQGDTIVKTPSEYLDRKIEKSDLAESVVLGMKEKLDNFLERLNIINSFGYGQRYACYDGPVTLIDAGLGYTEEEERAKLDNATGRYSNLTIVPMKQYTHSDLFRVLDLIPFYERLIEKCRRQNKAL